MRISFKILFLARAWSVSICEFEIWKREKDRIAGEDAGRGVRMWVSGGGEIRVAWLWAVVVLRNLWALPPCEKLLQSPNYANVAAGTIRPKLLHASLASRCNA